MSNSTEAQMELEESSYGYTPTLGVTLFYAIAFGLSALAYLVISLRSKWWILCVTMLLGCGMEAAGWIGRVWSAKDVLADDPFMLQIICLVIAPVFYSAWLYTLFGMAMTKMGPQYSYLRPKIYIIVFVSADVFSLVVQSIGGGWAAAADNPPKTPTDIMVGGIVFQLAIMLVYSALVVDFFRRVRSRKPYTKWERVMSRDVSSVEMAPLKNEGPSRVRAVSALSVTPAMTPREERGWNMMFIGVAISSVMIIIRGFYRSAELSQGWHGYLITHEIYFNTFDGITMIITAWTFVVFHPAFWLPKKESWRGSSY